MSGEVVMEEELAAHEVEGEVMRSPAEKEEARGVVEPGACTYQTHLLGGTPLVHEMEILTGIQCINSTALRKLICAYDTRENCQ